MRQLQLCVSGIRACPDTASTDDCERKGNILDVIVRVNADAVARLDAEIVEASDELSDHRARLGVRDGSQGSGCVHEDGFVDIVGRVVSEEP